MKMNKLKYAVMMALILLSQMANATSDSEYRELNYVGGGRYTCEGNCEKFDREQKNRNRDVEMRERFQRENRQDNQRIIDELKKGN